MTDPALQLETCELADEIRALLRDRLGEDARIFYGDDATAFVRVKSLDHWLWSWRLEIGDDVSTTAVYSASADDVVQILTTLLDAGWVRNSFIHSQEKET